MQKALSSASCLAPHGLLSHFIAPRTTSLVMVLADCEPGPPIPIVNQKKKMHHKVGRPSEDIFSTASSSKMTLVCVKLT